MLQKHGIGIFEALLLRWTSKLPFQGRTLADSSIQRSCPCQTNRGQVTKMKDLAFLKRCEFVGYPQGPLTPQNASQSPKTLPVIILRPSQR